MGFAPGVGEEYQGLQGCNHRFYTGADTRIVKNTSKPRSKTGITDDEINLLTLFLIIADLASSLVMCAFRQFQGPWYRYLIRFFLLFSYMIPITLRINLELGKMVHSWIIQRDKNIPGTIVRTLTIAEELGRIGYLLTDKTGTLTQNIMKFKRIAFGTLSFSKENQNEITNMLEKQFIERSLTSQEAHPSTVTSPSISTTTRKIIEKVDTTQVCEAIKALALCHNVTPVLDESTPTEFDVSTKKNDEAASATDSLRTSYISLHTNDESDAIELLPSTG